MSTTTQGRAVLTAESLEDLLEALGECEREAARARDEGECDEGEPTDSRHGYDLSELPTFGGPYPADTSGIYSWDPTRLLVADGSAWELVERQPERLARARDSWRLDG